MTKYHQPLCPNEIYHLFSRGVGSEKIFLSTDNYTFFLQKLKQHTSAICQIYCYALLPNHFHLLTKIKDEESVIKHFEEVKKVSFLSQKHQVSDFIMERFSNFLNSYTKSFNKSINRKGALFMDYLKRSRVNNSGDFTTYIWYIHKNAVHHQITKAIGEWKFDSYNSIIHEAPTSLLRKEVIECFGNKNEFIKFHQQPISPKINKDLDIEDV